MNFNFISNVSSNFVEKYFDNSTELKENLSSFLMKTVQDMRKEDNFLYEEICDLSALNKVAILESRLELELLPVLKINDKITNCLLESYQEYINEQDDTYEYDSEDVYNTIYEGFFKKKIQKFADEKDPEVVDKFLNAIKYIFKKSPTIAAIGLPFSPVSLMVSIMGLGAILLATATSDLVGGPNLVKEQMDLVNDVVTLINSAAGNIKDATEGMKYRFLLTFKNEEKCYKIAGFDPDKMGLRHFINAKDVKDETFTKTMLLGGEEQKLERLRNCYLENFLDRISIFFDLYFDCLKKSGNWNEVRSLSDDKFIQMFRLKGGLYPMCDEYKDNAIRAIKTYEKLVKFIFEDKPEKRSQWIILLNRYILDKRESQDVQMNKHRDSYQKRSPFQSDKYKKLGRNL